MTTTIHRLRQFTRSRRGNVAVMTALCALPLLGMVGLSIDYANAILRKTKLDAAADAAAISAITKAQAVIAANSGTTGTALTDGQTQGAAAFNANAGASPPPAKVIVQRDTTSNTVNATVTYNATSTANFGKLFGVSSINLQATTKSSAGLKTYKTIYLAADISQSMGIASTQTDMNNLVAYIKYYYSSHGRTPANSTQQNGCVFGCHVPTTWQNSGDKSVEDMAHYPIDGYPAVTLRIDSVKQAFKNIINTASTQSNGSPTIKIGIYSLQEQITLDNASYYKTVSAPTTDYPTLLTFASSLDLGNNDASGVGDSDFTNSINGFATQVSTSGDGSSTSSPQNFVFLVTDGVYDVKGSSCTDTHCTKAFDYNLCQQFKDKGVKVGVIYTTYTQFPNEQTFVDLVQPFWSNIATNLKSCASDGYYYEASDGAAIQTAVNALFNQATSSSKLTQ